MPYEKTDYHDSGGGRIERADGVPGLCGYVEGCERKMEISAEVLKC